MRTRNDILPNHLSTILRKRGPLTPESLWSDCELEIDDFYDQLKAEESAGLLSEERDDAPTGTRILKAIP